VKFDLVVSLAGRCAPIRIRLSPALGNEIVDENRDSGSPPHVG
jgi:hypothetical protein